MINKKEILDRVESLYNYSFKQLNNLIVEDIDITLVFTKYSDQDIEALKIMQNMFLKSSEILLKNQGK